MTSTGSGSDDIVTTVWIDPNSGADHSITVMRCGDQWWSYVDTTRISEDCATKESAIAAAKAHLTDRYKLKASAPIASSMKTSNSPPAAAQSRPRRFGVIAAALVGVTLIGAAATAAFMHRNLASDFVSSFAIAETENSSIRHPAGLPPLPSRKSISTARLTTGAINSRTVTAKSGNPRTIAIANYKPTSTTVRDAPTQERVRLNAESSARVASRTAPVAVESSSSARRPATSPAKELQFERRSEYTPTTHQQNNAPAAAMPGLQEEDIAGRTRGASKREEAVERSTLLTSARTGDVAAAGDKDRSLNDAARPPVRPITRRAKQRKVRRSRKAHSKRQNKRRAVRKVRRKLRRRGYRGRRLFTVRRVRIGRRVVKIVRFNRPRTRREYRRMQAVRSRIIAQQLRQRRRRYGY